MQAKHWRDEHPLSRWWIFRHTLTVATQQQQEYMHRYLRLCLIGKRTPAQLSYTSWISVPSTAAQHHHPTPTTASCCNSILTLILQSFITHYTLQPQLQLRARVEPVANTPRSMQRNLSSTTACTRQHQKPIPPPTARTTCTLCRLRSNVTHSTHTHTHTYMQTISKSPPDFATNDSQLPADEIALWIFFSKFRSLLLCKCVWRFMEWNDTKTSYNNHTRNY